ncbi:hypothetical protein ACI79Z_05210, partial [Geodermatophilus sp. SYSU D00663]
VPVYGNEATLRPLAERLAAALAGRDWRLRLVVDASPDGRPGAPDGLADGVGVVDREDADDGAGGRVRRLKGLGGGVPVDRAGGGVGDRVHLLGERHVAQVTRQVTHA